MSQSVIGKKKSQNFNNILSLSPLLKLEKHPSAKNLLDNKGTINPNDNLNIENDFSGIKIDTPKSSGNNVDFSNKIQYEIFVSEIDDKIEKPKENLFIKNEENIPLKKNHLNNNNKKKAKVNIFEFNHIQKKLDEEITMDILCNNGYESIEEKLKFYLKN